MAKGVINFRGLTVRGFGEGVIINLMAEQWIDISQQDRSKGLIYVKLLDLLTPEKAAQRGLTVDQPVLTTNDGRVDTLFTYQRVGQIVEAPKFTPSLNLGITFDALPSYALENGSHTARATQLNSWSAIVEPQSPVYTFDEERVIDYRYAKSVKIAEFRCYCHQCLLADYPIPASRNRPSDRPLNSGLVVDTNPGADVLKAICGLEKHPNLEGTVRYRFNITDQGEFVLSS